MDRTLFGVEFEVCVCDYELPIEEDKMEDKEYINYLEAKFDKKLRELGFKKGANVFASSKPHIAHDYSKWLVTIDSSIECPRTQNEIPSSGFIHSAFRGLKEDKVCKFHGSEIVSPVTPFTRHGIMAFFNMFNEVLFQPGFVYETNDSQGMHINISHPDQNNLEFLRFWWFFEDVILSYLPHHRRNNLAIMAMPLRRIFYTLDNLETYWRAYYSNKVISKFSAVSVKENRLEIRVVDSNLIPLHVFSWVRFIVSLLYASITMDLNTSVAPSTDYLFDKYIKNPELKAYFMSKEAEFAST